MSKHSKWRRANVKRKWVEIPPWCSVGADYEETWSYEAAMRFLKDRGCWPEVPNNLHFAEFCDLWRNAEDDCLSGDPSILMRSF